MGQNDSLLQDKKAEVLTKRYANQFLFAEEQDKNSPDTYYVGRIEKICYSGESTLFQAILKNHWYLGKNNQWKHFKNFEYTFNVPDVDLTIAGGIEGVNLYSPTQGIISLYSEAQRINHFLSGYGLMPFPE